MVSVHGTLRGLRSPHASMDNLRPTPQHTGTLAQSPHPTLPSHPQPATNDRRSWLNWGRPCGPRGLERCANRPPRSFSAPCSPPRCLPSPFVTPSTST
eukprot:1466068-Prymnesium_polylepis.1